MRLGRRGDQSDKGNIDGDGWKHSRDASDVAAGLSLVESNAEPHCNNRLKSVCVSFAYIFAYQWDEINPTKYGCRHCL
jgi:hypothetical protein